MSQPPVADADHSAPWYRLTLSRQMVLALVIGAAVGMLFPHFAVSTAILR